MEIYGNIRKYTEMLKFIIYFYLLISIESLYILNYFFLFYKIKIL